MLQSNSESPPQPPLNSKTSQVQGHPFFCRVVLHAGHMAVAIKIRLAFVSKTFLMHDILSCPSVSSVAPQSPSISKVPGMTYGGLKITLQEKN